MYNEAGSIIFSPYAAPFGISESEALEQVQPFLYTGHERDWNSAGSDSDDLDYMHMRTYWPQYGRFTSPDPVGGSVASPQSWNRNAYVLGNPMSLVDPRGLEGGGFGVEIDVAADFIPFDPGLLGDPFDIGILVGRDDLPEILNEILESGRSANPSAGAIRTCTPSEKLLENMLQSLRGSNVSFGGGLGIAGRVTVAFGSDGSIKYKTIFGFGGGLSVGLSPSLGAFGVGSRSDGLSLSTRFSAALGPSAALSAHGTFSGEGSAALNLGLGYGVSVISGIGSQVTFVNPNLPCE